MRYLSVCSGIEAATEAWRDLGWQCAGVSEIEKFPRAVLEQRLGAVPVDDDHRHTPGANITPLFGDFTKIRREHVGPIDLLVGGTPCQSFSVAGKRLGLDDPRGNLTLEFLALARRVQPRWIVWENVPGVLSHDEGRTMGTFLRLVGECGFRWAYRVLDAQYVRVGRFGRAVPQRRRRVLLVGYSGTADIDPRAVLFDRQSLRGDPAPRREAGEGVAVDVAPSLVSSGRGVERTGETRGQDPVVAFDKQRLGEYGDGEVASTCSARDYKDATDLVAHALRGEGFDASEDGTGRGTPIVPCYAATDSGTQRAPGMVNAWGVRRLTPRECERLMGFPDDFTKIEWRGKAADKCPDGPRYKALGNSMAVNVMCWIGERIEQVETIAREASRKAA